MARKARERAESGIYYVEITGNNKLIFVEDDDCRKFLELLRAAAEEDFAEICAYVLLSEKICLVVKEGLGGISELMRSVLPKYTARYNRKYRRSGKLFYDRFKSRPLETAEEALDAVRYVHRLPLKNGAKELRYAFSSYGAYDKGAAELKGGTVMMLCGDSPARFRLEMERESGFIVEKPLLTDADIAEMLKERLAGLTPSEVENLTPERQADAVRYLHERGVSIRRLAALLGVNKSAVERTLKAAGTENA